MTILDKDLLLANGAVVPLRAAAGELSRLEYYLGSTDADDRRVVKHLRDLCLGRSVAATDITLLAEKRLLDAAGEVDPVMREVVLTAVRGEEDSLYLTSMAVDQVDRALIEYDKARTLIWAHLPGNAGREVVEADDLQTFEDELRTAFKWADRAAGRGRSRDTDHGSPAP